MFSLLKVAKLKDGCKVLGPEVRFVVWFYGCSRNCPRCVAESMNKSGVFTEYTPEELAAKVIAAGVNGVTLSGGEPLEQNTQALLRFLQLLKEAGKNVICYTGMNYDIIKHTPFFQEIFQHIDLLIDGEYLEDQDNGTYLRGSDNQRFIPLSDFFKDDVEIFANKSGRELEIELDRNNSLDIAGIPQKGFLNILRKKLDDNGLTVY